MKLFDIKAIMYVENMVLYCQGKINEAEDHRRAKTGYEFQTSATCRQQHVVGQMVHPTSHKYR